MIVSGHRSIRARTPHRAGFTFIEVIVALVLMMFGAIAVTQLTGIMGSVNQRMGLAMDALTLANQLAAELLEAKCYGPDPPDHDDALAIGLHNGQVGAAMTVGSFPTGNPRLMISYEVRNCLACADPFSASPSATPATPSIGGIDIVITVDNDPSILRDPSIQLAKPVQIFLRREYTVTMTEHALRRGFAP